MTNEEECGAHKLCTGFFYKNNTLIVRHLVPDHVQKIQ